MGLEHPGNGPAGLKASGLSKAEIKKLREEELNKAAQAAAAEAAEKVQILRDTQLPNTIISQHVTTSRP